MSGEVAVHLGPPVLDKVERSWSCWRHPNASGVGLKVAGAMETVGLTKPKATFWRGGVAQWVPWPVPSCLLEHRAPALALPATGFG